MKKFTILNATTSSTSPSPTSTTSTTSTNIPTTTTTTPCPISCLQNKFNSTFFKCNDLTLSANYSSQNGDRENYVAICDKLRNSRETLKEETNDLLEESFNNSDEDPALKCGTFVRSTYACWPPKTISLYPNNFFTV